MARRATQHAEAPGQDSFLDVVANLVGIIIILIIVVGVAAKKAVVMHGAAAALAASHSELDSTNDPADDTDAVATDNSDSSASSPSDSAATTPEPLITDADIREAKRSMNAVEASIFETAGKLQRDQLEVNYRRLERDRVQALVTLAERAVEEQRDKLAEERRSEFDESRALEEARRELADLQRAQLALERARPTKGILEHLPTPMAKTVFGKEVHLRLAGGRLAFIPWDDLVERLKADVPRKVHRLQETPSFTETLGPVDGFSIRYTMKRTEQRVGPGSTGPVQQRAELDRFLMLPMADDVGESVEQALRANSDFLARFERLDPARTTVTVWVYPDSFGYFRTFKKLLFEKGFLTAARPLPDGHPVGGSPDGSRSTAE
ncbi:MAG: hypothetical protein ACKOBW_12470 [Planctomycetota bacterium]